MATKYEIVSQQLQLIVTFVSLWQLHVYLQRTKGVLIIISQSHIQINSVSRKRKSATASSQNVIIKSNMTLQPVHHKTEI